MTAGLVSSQFCAYIQAANQLRGLLTNNSDVRSDQRRSRRSSGTRNSPRRPCEVDSITSTAIPLEQSYLLIPDACVIVLQSSNDRGGKNRNLENRDLLPLDQKLFKPVRRSVTHDSCPLGHVSTVVRLETAPEPVCVI